MKIASEFTLGVLTGGMAELRTRRAKLQRFIAEAEELDVAIREMERMFGRLGLDADAPRTVLAVVPSPKPAAPAASPGRVQAGTNHEKALTLLRSHPRGLNTTVIRDQAGIPAGSVSVVLAQLVERGHAVKVGRGFWRVADAPQADVA